MRIVIVALAALLVWPAEGVAQAQDDAPILFDFTQVTEAGSFDGATLILNGVGDKTPYLSDRPERTIAGTIENAALVKAWDHRGVSGVSASLRIREVGAFPHRLTTAAFGPRTLSYGVSAVEGTIPKTFGPATLVIALNGCITGCSDICPFNFSRVFFNKLVPCKR